MLVDVLVRRWLLILIFAPIHKGNDGAFAGWLLVNDIVLLKALERRPDALFTGPEFSCQLLSSGKELTGLQDKHLSADYDLVRLVRGLDHEVQKELADIGVTHDAAVLYLAVNFDIASIHASTASGQFAHCFLSIQLHAPFSDLCRGHGRRCGY